MKQSARESLSCALFQVDENLIQAVEYDKAPLGGDDFKCAIHIDWGRRALTEHLFQHGAQTEIG